MLEFSIAPGTATQYKASLKILLQAASSASFDPLHMSEDDLLFTCVFFVLSRSVHSLDSFLSGLDFHLKMHGSSLPKGATFRSLRRSMLRIFAAPDAPQQAYPLTQDEVEQMVLYGSRIPSAICLLVWLLMAFLFALRPEDVAHGRITWRDISFFPDGGVDLKVQPGKSRGQPHPVTVFSVPPHAGSVLNLRKYLLALASRSFPDGKVALDAPVIIHLSTFRKGSPISTSTLSKRLRELFSKATGRPAPHLLSAYSLRRGGATTYYNKGVAPVRLQHLLRHVHFNTTAKYVDVQSHRSSRRATTAAVLR